MPGVVSKPSPEIRDVIRLLEVLVRSTSKPIELAVKEVTVKVAVADKPAIGVLLTLPSKSTVNESPTESTVIGAACASLAYVRAPARAATQTRRRIVVGSILIDDSSPFPGPRRRDPSSS